MSDFAALLDDLENFAKAKGGEPPGDDDGEAGDDKAIQAAAKDGKKEGGGEETTTTTTTTTSDKDDDKMGKAMTATLADGTQVEAIDATEVIAGLQEQNASLVEQVAEMQKAMGFVLTAMKQMRGETSQQTNMLKALRTSQGNLAAQGTGRRTMVSVAEKLVTGTGNAEPKATPASVMMKATQMCDAKQLGWEAISRLEAYHLRNELGPPDLLTRYPALLTP